MSPLRVRILAYPGCFASEVYGVPDLLLMAAHVAAASGVRGPSYEVAVMSSRRRVVAAGGATIDVCPLRAVDVLVVPGFELHPTVDLDTTLAELRPEVAAVSAHAATGAAVVSVCVGAFLLAEAGVLDGRRATTSWLFADRLALRHPAVTVCADDVVVTDRGVTTAGGFSAMYDFALTLIREHDGPRVARSTARMALVDDARSAQTPYVDSAMLPALNHEFSSQVKRRLDQQIGAPYDLTELARGLQVSTRTLLRRFAAETGQTPLAYLQSRRVRRAGQLLETTDRTVASIAADVGYADAGAFSATFRRHVGRRPSDYRATFRRPTESSVADG